MNDDRLTQLEQRLDNLERAQRDFLSTRIEERDFRVEGVLNIKGARISAGDGVPTFPAPTGSLYLRRNGSASATLYIREGTAWRRVTTTTA